MFGHQDDQSTQQDNQGLLDENAQDQLLSEGVDAAPTPAVEPVAAPGNDTSWQHPGDPVDSSDTSPTDVISPAGGFPKAPSFSPGGESDPVEDNPRGANLSDDATTHELVDIKQHALTELLPLIDKLDQTPEDRFKTLLMMIQASDDPHLIKAAYESAHKISDEKIRARALLDIVNEINYFTQATPKA